MSNTSSSLPSSSTTPLSSVPLTPKEDQTEREIIQPEHAFYAFDSLIAHLEHRTTPPPHFDDIGSYALFVTWNTDRGERGKPSLRGCIGTFAPTPLSKGLKKYALISALEDSRFPPIKQSEMTQLSVNISLLTPFQSISNPLDWEIGKHGIHITFPNPAGRGQPLHATYLPEVASEQGWSKEETILSAIQKAGYRGKVVVGDFIWKSLDVKVYTSQKIGVTYAEYAKWTEDRE